MSNKKITNGMRKGAANKLAEFRIKKEGKATKKVKR
jgi:hypothetical protein